MERRRLRLLLARDGRLLHDSGELPHLDVELRALETTCSAAWRALPELGLHGPVLDCFIDQEGTPADDGRPIHAALVELDGFPPGWTPPAGWSWRPASGAPPDVEPGLRPALAARLAEIAGEMPVHPLRMPWAHPGWYRRATAWIDDALAAAGRSRSTSVVQYRHWSISAVMIVETAEGRCWFKAAGGPMRREAAITALLHEVAPSAITPVLAVDADQGWLLLEDIVGDVVAEDPGPTAAAFDRLLGIQLDLAGRNDDLLDAGCPHRPLAALVADVRAALASPPAEELLRLPVGRADELLDRLTAAVEVVEACGLPDGLVHGDFHPGNVIVGPRGITIFDWSDAAVSNPLVDVATWASWFTADPARVDALHGAFRNVRSARLGHATGEAFDGLDRGTVDAVTGGYHLVSYARIISELEPHRRIEHAGGVTDFFALLDSATSA